MSIISANFTLVILYLHQVRPKKICFRKTGRVNFFPDYPAAHKIFIFFQIPATWYFFVSTSNIFPYNLYKWSLLLNSYRIYVYKAWDFYLKPGVVYFNFLFILCMLSNSNTARGLPDEQVKGSAFNLQQKSQWASYIIVVHLTIIRKCKYIKNKLEIITNKITTPFFLYLIPYVYCFLCNISCYSLSQYFIRLDRQRFLRMKMWRI